MCTSIHQSIQPSLSAYPSQMLDTPQKAPFETKEQLCYSELPRDVQGLRCQPSYRGKLYRQLVLAISFFQWLPPAHDHRWGFELRCTGKSKALPSDTAPFSPRWSGAMSAVGQQFFSPTEKPSLPFAVSQDGLQELPHGRMEVLLIGSPTPPTPEVFASVTTEATPLQAAHYLSTTSPEPTYFERPP